MRVETQIKLIEFIKESNEIECIIREPLLSEIKATQAFIDLPKISIEDLISFVEIVEPKAQLRDKFDMNVRVGRYYPPFGGPQIRTDLSLLLQEPLDAYNLHIKYELLHPFTDCNGRSGRALWAWKHKDISIGFLRAFYYQTLQASQ